MALRPEDVAAVIVTRGDVDLAPTLEPLRELGEIVVWDNSIEDDYSVAGRYMAIGRTAKEVILTVDDDVVLSEEAVSGLVGSIVPMRGIPEFSPPGLVANMPERFRHDFYRAHCLVGFGAIFQRDLPSLAFEKYLAWEKPSWTLESFPRTCDIVFTALTPYVLVDLPYADRDYASAPGRMWTTNGHVAERRQMRDLVFEKMSE